MFMHVARGWLQARGRGRGGRDGHRGHRGHRGVDARERSRPSRLPARGGLAERFMRRDAHPNRGEKKKPVVGPFSRALPGTPRNDARGVP